PGTRWPAFDPALPPRSTLVTFTREADPAPAAPAAAPRTAERALADGQAALGRRDYPSAEAAAREVIAARGSARAQDAQILLGDALLGKRDFQNAALAYDDAYRRNRTGSRAPEAMIGLSNAFLGFGAKREACATLDDLRSEFPRLSGGLADRAADARKRGGCR
ncbi:tetratricopeptide repeat protein, partial [Roseomonas sp. GC11]|uniref:tetratricopeptide repeat protein n=1 Tax=Roseomonas sp. GC11 TaxID=2950546 RepID=UPI00210B5375